MLKISRQNRKLPVSLQNPVFQQCCWQYLKLIKITNLAYPNSMQMPPAAPRPTGLLMRFWSLTLTPHRPRPMAASSTSSALRGSRTATTSTSTDSRLSAGGDWVAMSTNTRNLAWYMLTASRVRNGHKPLCVVSISFVDDILGFKHLFKKAVQTYYLPL